MGSPSIDYMCIGGHLVHSTGRHCVEDFTPIECPFCSSRKFTTLIGWGDSETCPVPVTPLRKDLIMGMEVPIYDVSKVEDSDWKKSHVLVDYLVDSKSGKISTYYSKGTINRGYFVSSLNEQYGVKIDPSLVHYKYYRNISAEENELKFCKFVVDECLDSKEDPDWYRVTVYEMYKDKGIK
jgi:hypothetical protein